MRSDRQTPSGAGVTPSIGVSVHTPSMVTPTQGASVVGVSKGNQGSVLGTHGTPRSIPPSVLTESQRARADVSPHPSPWSSRSRLGGIRDIIVNSGPSLGEPLSRARREGRGRKGFAPDPLPPASQRANLGLSAGRSSGAQATPEMSTAGYGGYHRPSENHWICTPTLCFGDWEGGTSPRIRGGGLRGRLASSGRDLRRGSVYSYWGRFWGFFREYVKRVHPHPGGVCALLSRGVNYGMLYSDTGVKCSYSGASRRREGSRSRGMMGEVVHGGGMGVSKARVVQRDKVRAAHRIRRRFALEYVEVYDGMTEEEFDKAVNEVIRNVLSDAERQMLRTDILHEYECIEQFHRGRGY